MRYLKYYFLTLLFVGSNTLLNAHLPPEEEKNTSKTQKTIKASYRMDCAQATAQIDQEINNVRSRLLAGGDVWWDGDDGRYIVPKIDPASGLPEVASIFAGAVWLGGLDPALNLKVAGQTYGTAVGQTDFWPGPLTEIGTVGADTCALWDRFFKVLGSEIDEHLRNYEAAQKEGIAYDPDIIPRNVKGWPSRGNQFFFEVHEFELPNTIQGLAAFFDRDGDGDYEPTDGDYPRIEIRGCDLPQYPDEMIFWIYNDAGGIHTESNGDAIQMEVQVQSFAYATNDEINDMTFQRYKLINRAVESIDSTFFAMWIDPDLGCYTDDYVGCDTSRSLMFIYNEDALDGEASCNDCPQGVNTYCTKIPILGCDYFRGPLDENGDEIGMSSFTYYNNGGVGNPLPGTTDPNVAQEFYNYLSGSWRDGTPFTAGGNAYNLGSVDFINYAFTEPPNDPNGWSMCTEALPFGDRRTVQASGPFRLDPGAVNELIIGVVWISELDYPCPDITPLLFADDVAQALFDNCFDITDGPDAPDVDWVELDKELVAVFTNDEITSNNAFEEYQELDLRAPETVPEEDRVYKFEGYKLYQLAGPNSSLSDVDDPNQVRLVASVDIKNGISEIFNWTPVSNPSSDPNAPNAIWVPTSETPDATDDGILHTFRITEDQFAVSDRRLINHKKYYFTAIAYAHNEYEEFSQQNGVITGQRTPYLEGRRNIRTYVVIPRPIVNKVTNSNYGDGVVITRLDGVGVGGGFLSVSDETREAMFNGSLDGSITYEPGGGPIEIKIYNPLGVVNGDYELTFVDENLSNDELDNEVNWTLTNLNTNEVIASEQTIELLNEQIVAQYGFTVGIVQSDEPGDLTSDENGAIGATISYGDQTLPQWFQAIPDVNGGTQFEQVFNFIKTGANEADNNLDPTQSLSTMGDGFFVPYTLCDYRNLAGAFPYITPAWMNSTSDIVRVRNPLDELNNVDIVLTSDKSKWSRCVIVETASPLYYETSPGSLGIPTEGNALNFQLRSAPSVGQDDSDGDGLPDPDGDGEGMGWFPGYAVDVETGERLNIFFGENSTYNGELFGDKYDAPGNGGKQIGNDMMWNPTSQLILDTGTPSLYQLLAGGQHYIYVTKQAYDECAFIRGRLVGSNFQRVNALEQISWTALPVLPTGEQLMSYADGLIPNEVVVSLRVDQPYEVFIGTGDKNGYPTYQFSINDLAPSEVASELEINEALKAINVVPNPYFGFSDYETTQFTTTVKFTNLPAECTLTIYTLDGKFIRQYKRNEVGVSQNSRTNPGILVTQITPAIEWDLKNHRGIPIASGTYLIHVDAPGLGERVLKWFGVARQFDPSGL